MSRALLVEDPGPSTTVQDQGRPGLAHLGVPESGALDPGALRLANRLVGNPEGAAGLEVTFGGLRFRARGRLVVALTGAPLPLTVAGSPAAVGAAVVVPDGARVALGAPSAGVRSYLAVRGGVAGREVLGSAATDLLSGLGNPLAAGEEVAVGPPPGAPVPAADPVPVGAPPTGEVELRVDLGPRADWLTVAAVGDLVSASWTVTDRSNRIGLRLAGPELVRAVERELPSEGVVAGAVQVPANGQPVLFLADHPVTGGYPVAAVVRSADLPRAAQLRPGQRVRLRAPRG